MHVGWQFVSASVCIGRALKTHLCAYLHTLYTVKCATYNLHTQERTTRTCAPFFETFRTLHTMQTIQELIFEANRIHREEPCGEVSADAILVALATLAASGKRPKDSAFQPANPDLVLEHFATAARDAMTATAADTYRAIYGRDGNTAELRTMASAMRGAGWVSYRSNGRTVWRRRNPLVDGLMGLENGAEIHRRVLEWAASEEFGPHATASAIFTHIFKRIPTSVEARAVGAVLREAGYPSKRSNGRTVFAGRRPGTKLVPKGQDEFIDDTHF